MIKSWTFLETIFRWLLHFLEKKSEEHLYELHSFLNTLNPNIQFTLKFSDCSISFLDIMVLKYQWRISTDVYCKTTDTHQYLIFKSCHPTHTKRNRLTELKIYLHVSAQTNPEKLAEKAKNISQNILRTTRKKRKRPIFNSFYSTCNPKHFIIFQEAKKNLSIIERVQELQQLIKKYDLLHSQRQPQNLTKYYQELF